MDNFRIIFLPEIPRSSYCLDDFSIDNLDIKKIHEKFPDHIDVIYCIHGKNYSYCPSSILTIINDLYLEIDLLDKRKDHLVRLSGYGILGIKIASDSAILYSAQDFESGNLKTPVAEPVNLEDIERELSTRLGDILSYISSG